MNTRESKKIGIGVIINPIAGTRHKIDLPRLLNELIDKERFKLKIMLTQCGGHATQLARELVRDGYSYIVAAGGDGTVNETARGLIHTSAALGIIPLGSGNGLARHLCIPMDISKAIKLLNEPKIKVIDYGKANDTIFFCTCGVGFDAHIGQKFAEAEKRGFFTYLKTTIKEFFLYRPRKYKIITEEGKIVRRAFLVTIANASQYGNNAYIAPDALIDDGLLDISILEPFPLIIAPQLGFQLFTKKISANRYVTSFKCKKLTLKRKKSGIFHFDGEPMKQKKKIKIKVINKGLNVLVPIKGF